VGDEYALLDSETGEKIGHGIVIKMAPYLGRKSFQTDEPGERFDTGYREVVLELDAEADRIPIGLSVIAEVNAGAPAGPGQD
jgi:hypothetical protein